MDGTLVETEQFWGLAMAELADAAGRTDVRGGAQPDHRHEHAGGDGRAARGPRASPAPRPSAASDARWVEERTAQLMAGGIDWRPGAAELLRAVRAAGLRTALVTTTPRRLAEIVLGSIRADLGDDPFDVDGLR